MPFTINYDSKLHCLKSKFTGPMNVAQTKAFAGELAKHATENNCCILLNDLREAIIDMSTFELYSMPMIVANEGMNRKWKRAILCSDDQVKSLSYYETVAKDKGWNVKIFSDNSEAEAWLAL